MAWFKVDDGFLTSSKVMSIPRTIRAEALGVWLQAGVWAAHEMKDGLVPPVVLEEYGCRDEVRAALVDSHLWVEAERGCVLFHNWDKYQPTREELESKRLAVSAARSEAGKRGADRRWNGKNGKTMANDSPEPEPEPEPLKDSRGMRLDPLTFSVTDDMRDWAKKETPTISVDAELPKFFDYWCSVAGSRGVKRDWVAAWRTWMRNAKKWSGDVSAADVDAARADRERRLAQHEEFKRERAEAEAKAVPAPKCVHGKNVALCLPCASELAVA